MRAILLTVLPAILLLIAIGVAVLVVAAIFLGLGWVLALVFPVSTMEATVVLMFVAGVVAFYFTLSDVAQAIRSQSPFSWLAPPDNEVWEDEDDWEEPEPVPPPPAWRRSPVKWPSRTSSTTRATTKVGRNDPCPCGSGKKYKYCCGR